MIQELFTDQRHRSDIHVIKEISEMHGDIEEQGKRGKHSQLQSWWFKSRDDSTFSLLQTHCLSVCLCACVCVCVCVCVCREHNVLCQSCQILVFVSHCSLSLFIVHSLYSSVKRLSKLPPICDHNHFVSH